MPEITIPSKDNGSFAAYVAMPETLPAPTIVVIQEIFGVNQVMRDRCDELAAQGFIAVCPDLFWRIEPGIQLTDKSEEEWARAFELFGLFDVDKGVEDLRATEHTFKGHADSTGKVGCIGYCLGGKLAYLMACRSSVDCSIGYYGVGIEDLLDEAPQIKKPLMLHIAEKDQFVPPEAQQKIHAALDNHDHVTLHDYAGCDHAFARPGGDHYDEKAATAANQRTFDFLKNSLS